MHGTIGVGWGGEFMPEALPCWGGGGVDTGQYLLLPRATVVSPLTHGTLPGWAGLGMHLRLPPSLASWHSSEQGSQYRGWHVGRAWTHTEAPLPQLMQGHWRAAPARQR